MQRFRKSTSCNRLNCLLLMRRRVIRRKTTEHEPASAEPAEPGLLPGFSWNQRRPSERIGPACTSAAVSTGPEWTRTGRLLEFNAFPADLLDSLPLHVRGHLPPTAAVDFSHTVYRSHFYHQQVRSGSNPHIIQPPTSLSGNHNGSSAADQPLAPKGTATTGGSVNQVITTQPTIIQIPTKPFKPNLTTSSNNRTFRRFSCSRRPTAPRKSP
ncbi:hypothetical protein L596_019103 [Steinernema carpocapsae]|uniref:Uncharacterized protein n=1 Tax=Steinernema carpocapsae TaxID=34508 RepID=A0A4U5N6V1_STECR|nr:hypothetical protein L596_019103 [Steinernema carpocapsae]